MNFRGYFSIDSKKLIKRFFIILGIFIMFLRTSCIEKETENNERERKKKQE